MSRRDERGAALVEYMVLVALVLLAAMPAVKYIGRAADDEMNDTGSAVGGTDIPDDGWPDDGDPDGPGGPGDPPDASTTTTTTTAPTTVAKSVFSGTDTDSSWLSWSGRAIVKVTGPGGTPLAGVAVEVRISGPNLSPTTVHVTTGADGRAVVEVGPYWNFGTTVDRVDIEIKGVTGPGVTWDGDGGKVTLKRP